MNLHEIAGFRDELEKIAIVETLKWGYYGGDPAHAKLPGNYGRLGRWARHGVINYGPAMAVKDALEKEDLSGQGRSRTERMTGAAAGTAAGYLGAGALTRLAKGKWGLLTNMAGGMAGQIAGERLSTLPWRRRAARKAQEAAQKGREE